MITHMHIENFKCFKDFDIDLGPFNVLIGPNDSGKTAFLMAIRLLGAFAGTGQMPLGRGGHCIWRGKGGEIVIRAFAEERAESEKRMGGEVRSTDGVNYGMKQLPHPDGTPQPGEKFSFKDCMGRVTYFRLNPLALREPSFVAGKMDEAGKGFPTFLDDNLRADRTAFQAMEKTFYDRFWHYCGIVIEKTRVAVERQERDAFAIAFIPREGQKLPAEAVSDGVMLSLAFIAMTYAPNPPRVMLIEEPENCIHHASLKETIKTLQALSKDKGIQIILTTHSPYLLDHVEPEQVRVFSKDDEGAAHAFKLSDHPDVEKMKKHFMAGEIWTGLEEEGDFYEKLGAKQ